MFCKKYFAKITTPNGQSAKRGWLEKMRIENNFRIEQCSAPDDLIRPSFGRFTEQNPKMRI